MEKLEQIQQKIKISDIVKRIVISVAVICIIAFFISGSIFLKGYNEIKQQNNMYVRLQDSIKTYHNEKGELVSQIEILQAINTSRFLELQTQDKTIKWLQEEVKANKNKIKDGGSISVIGTEVLFTGSNGTTVSFDVLNPPVIGGDTVYLYPIYSSQSKDTTWIKYNITAKKDTTILDLKVRNEYSVLIGEVALKRKERKERNLNWFNRKVPVVEVTNKNPYDKVKTLRTFEVKDERKSRLGLGMGIGVGFTPKSVQPYIGIGLNYTLIKF